jgi:hypothetical protein
MTYSPVLSTELCHNAAENIVASMLQLLAEIGFVQPREFDLKYGSLVRFAFHIQGRLNKENNNFLRVSHSTQYNF